MGGNKVTFLEYEHNHAATRLRATIPQQFFTRGKDIIVAGKHWFDDETIKPFKKFVFDICDDKFHNRDLKVYYKRYCERADAITCNSRVMAEIIKKETGRDAFVIDDPYENEQKKAKKPGLPLYWFGHAINLKEINQIPYPCMMLTGQVWSFKAHEVMLDECGLVVLPASKPARSSNRAVAALRAGRYVVSEPVDSMEGLKTWQGDLKEGIDWAMTHRLEAAESVKEDQVYIERRYSPQSVAKQWQKVFDML